MENQYYSYPGAPTYPTKPKRKPYFVAILICSLICILTFFLPLCAASILIEVEFSGWTLSTGGQVLGTRYSGLPFLFIFLLIPIIMFASSLLCRYKLHHVAIGTGLTQFILLLVGSILLQNLSEVDISFTFWYYLNVLSALAAVFFGWAGLKNFSIVSWVTQKSLETQAAYSGRPYNGGQWTPAGGAPQHAQSRWECPSCHTVNNDSISFCPNCGQKRPAPAPWVCPSCHSTNDASIQFCPNCGTKKVNPLSSVTPLTPSKWECSACLQMNEPTVNFCPNCGRKRY